MAALQLAAKDRIGQHRLVPAHLMPAGWAVRASPNDFHGLSANIDQRGPWEAFNWMLARTGRRGQAAFDWQWFWHEYWHVRTVVRVKIRVSCASRYVVSVSLRCGARLYGKSCLARQYARAHSNFEKISRVCRLLY